MITWNQNVEKKPKLCYMDADSFIVNIETDYNYKDTVEDVETKFDALNHELNRSPKKGILKKVIQIRSTKYWSFLTIWLLICLAIKWLIQ